MILIWDNGGSYSDHTIFFINCGEHLSADDVTSFIRLGWRYRDGFEIARADSLEWRDDCAMSTPDAFMPKDELLDEHDESDLSILTYRALEWLLHKVPNASLRVYQEYARRTP